MSLEVLAPAGDMQAFNVAINNGADAVYLGLKGFNARAKAENFTTENIADVVKKAHLYGVKVYVTVNTLVANEEMPEFLKTVRAAVDAKADAFLVQDFGVADVLKRCFPGICLHASTQMGVHNLRGAKMVEKMGFSRIVLSREAKLSDIIEIKQKTNLEIEYFVQGALCVAFSGNCYFSAIKSQNSGNRGLCKQYCRMPYRVCVDGKVDGEEQYLLSPADLCLIKNLQKLVDAGVTSFKIEGRLRRLGYVAWAVSAYRRAVDFLQGKNKKFDVEKEIYNLKKVFSRGDFNYNAYLDAGVPNRVINKRTQNHTGIEIGKVVAVEPFKDLNRVTIKASQPLHFGDGLKFFSDGKEMLSLGVGNVDVTKDGLYQVYTKYNIKKGWLVNLILDFEMEKQKIDTERKIKISAFVTANQNSQLKLKYVCGKIEAEVESDFVCQTPKTCAMTDEQIAEPVSKLGDTNFVCEKCVVKTDGVFVAKSALSDLRRQCILKLEENILKEREPQAVCDLKETEKTANAKKMLKRLKNIYKNVIIFNNFDIFTEKQNVCDDNLWVFFPQDYSQKVFDELLKIKEKFSKLKFGLNLPIVANGEDLKLLDNFILKNKDIVLVANNVYGLSYVFDGCKVFCGTGLNMYSNFSENFFAGLGCVGAVVSVEQPKEKIDVGKNCVYCFGKFTLMTFCHCPYKTVYGNDCKSCSFGKALAYVDVDGRKYNINRYRLSQCYFELLNNEFVDCIDTCEYAKFIDIRFAGEKRIEQIVNIAEKN